MTPSAWISQLQRQWGRGQTAAESARRRALCAHGEASMGPRPNGRGKTLYTVQIRATSPASMGPRPNGRGKGPGRVQAVLVVRASMGPRPNGRGKSTYIMTPLRRGRRQWGRGQTAAERCSTGTVRSISPSTRQWGRGQTAAERPRAAQFAERRPGVNGAAAKRPRKVRGDRHVDPHGGASMGPRPNGRGKRAGRAICFRSPSCVNGAAAKRPRKVSSPALQST